MTKIFICYRRDDAKYQADRLHKALKKYVGDPDADIFIDIDHIPLGVDFVDFLDKKVSECGALIAVIGPNWLEARDPITGNRRLDDPNDSVRIEIASALKRDIPVIPFLLDGTQMPKSSDLPEDIASLARRHGIHVQFLSFEADVERMARVLRIGEQPTSPSVSETSSRPAKKIDEAVDPNMMSATSGAFPLLMAVLKGQANVVATLLAAGADPNKTHPATGGFPLLMAAENGHADIVEALLAAGADPNRVDPTGHFPLLVAVQNGHDAVVRRLLEAGGDISMMPD